MRCQILLEIFWSMLRPFYAWFLAFVIQKFFKLHFKIFLYSTINDMLSLLIYFFCLTIQDLKPSLSSWWSFIQGFFCISCLQSRLLRRYLLTCLYLYLLVLACTSSSLLVLAHTCLYLYLLVLACTWLEG